MVIGQGIKSLEISSNISSAGRKSHPLFTTFTNYSNAGRSADNPPHNKLYIYLVSYQTVEDITDVPNLHDRL
jgi:hypothetical protein